MNILVSGLHYEGSLASYYVKALEREGHYIRTFESSKAPRWVTKNSISFPLGRNINIQDILTKCEERPDLIFHVDGALRQFSGLKKTGIRSVFYAVDSHLTPNFHKNIICDFDYVFAAQKDYIPIFKKVKNEISWLPHASDPDVHKKYAVSKLFDIGFVGTQDSKRYAERINLLRKLSVKYGLLAANARFTDMSKIYSQSRIGFNRSLRGDLNMRVFEVMSSGTMLLTDRISNGMEDLFMDKKHLVLYNDEKEMLDLVEYYLENEDDREKIAAAGQKEVHEKHTYEQRVKEMMNVIEEYI